MKRVLTCSPDGEGEPKRLASATSASVAWLEWEAPGRLSRSSLIRMLERLKLGAALPEREALQLLEAGSDHLSSASPVRRLQLAPRTRLVILGDTHGQLEDFLWILMKQGLPSAEVLFLINGDVADRGKNAVEILLLLLAMALCDPGCIYLNRGNHEDAFVNEQFGFRDECVSKYGQERGQSLYHAFDCLFNTLPLCTAVDVSDDFKLFVVHGGVPRSACTLARIEMINHRRPVPNEAGPAGGDDEIFYDLLWSDPNALPGTHISSRGGDVVDFGPDVTTRFLEATGFDLIVRSHDVPSDGRGFEWHHAGRLVTVFSASNYCGLRGNMGAVLLVRAGEGRVWPDEHWAGSLEDLKELEAPGREAARELRGLREEERRLLWSRARDRIMRSLKAEVRSSVADLVVRRRRQLLDFCAGRDAETGAEDFHVSTATLLEACTEILSPQLPWKLLLRLLGIDGERVNYLRFVQRFRVASPRRPSWPWAVLRRVFRALLGSRLRMHAALAALDRNQDGSVSAEELGALCADCGVALSSEERREIATHCASTRVFELLDQLVGAYALGERAPAQAAQAWVPMALPGLAGNLLREAARRLGERPSSELLRELFQAADADGDGYLDPRELWQLFPELTEQAALELAAYVSSGTSGASVSYFELLAALAPASPEEDIVQNVASAAYLHRTQLLRTLQEYDSTGLAGTKDFAQALRSLTSDSLIHSAHVEALAGMGAGIDYVAFLASLHVEDSELQEPPEAMTSR